MKKNMGLLVGIILVGVAGVLVWSFLKSTPASTTCTDSDINCYKDITSWKTFTDDKKGITFKYPEQLPTTFVFAQEWPPVVNIKPEIFQCADVHKINGRDYCLGTETEGAAGSVYTTYHYSTDTAKGDETITLDFTLRAVQCGNYDAPEKEACENQQTNFSIDRLVDRMVTTLAKQVRTN